MEEIKFKCNSCGKEHINEFSFAFNSPPHYDSLDEKEKSKSKLSSDLCIVLDRDYFIRAILEIPIINTSQTLMWGVWVSQSKENFDYYAKHFHEDLSGRITFGWFSSILPEYENTLGLKTNVLFQGKNQRPKIEIQESDHQLHLDFLSGITMEHAIEITSKILHQQEAEVL